MIFRDIFLKRLGTPFLRSKYLLIAFPFFIYSCTNRVSYTHATSSCQTIAINDSLVKDSAAEVVISPYRTFLNEKMNEVIGYSEKELTKDLVESPLGNFTADALRNIASKYCGSKVDLAVVTIGGLRASIPKGTVHMADVYELMPFDNVLVVVTVDGSVLRQLFEYMCIKYNVAISNAKIMFRKSKLTYALVDGKPLDVKKQYTVAISDYLASGGDEMYFMRDAQKSTKTLPLLVREAILEYVKDLTKAGKKINAEVEKRFVVKNSF